MQPASIEMSSEDDLLLHRCQAVSPSSKISSKRGLALYSCATNCIVSYNSIFAELLDLTAAASVNLSVAHLSSIGLLPAELSANPITWPRQGHVSYLVLRLHRMPLGDQNELWHLQLVVPSSFSPPASQIRFVDETMQRIEEEKRGESGGNVKKVVRPRKAWQRSVITMRKFIKHAPQTDLLQFEPAPSPYIYPKVFPSVTNAHPRKQEQAVGHL